MELRLRKRRCWFAAATLLLGPCWLQPATAQLMGPELQVNTYTTSRQGFPALAADGSGNFVVVWNSYLQDGSGDGIFGQRYNAAGGPVGSEFQVNSHATSSQYAPEVATDGSGNFVVVWSSFTQDGSLSGVFGQRYSSAGSSVGSEFQVNTFTTGYQYAPAVAATGSGNFVVAWHSPAQDGSGYGVFGQRFDSLGSPVGNEFQVNSFTTGDQKYSAAAADGSGGFVVAWQSVGQDGSMNGVFGQRFDSAGSPLGSEFQVSSYTTNEQVYPVVATDGSGNFVVVWNSWLQDGWSYGVFGQRFDSAGSPLGSEFQVNSYTTSYQYSPEVAADGSGKFVVVWGSFTQDGSNWGVFGQRFNAAGTPAGSEFQVNSYTTDAQNFPSVSADPAGNFVVAWNSLAQDGALEGVFGQRLAGWTFNDGFETADACAWSAAVGGGCP